MHAKKILIRCASLLALCLLIAGCGKKGAANAAAFDKAAPEIKILWDQGLAADKANDFFAAATNYNQLVALESKLTPGQFDSAVTAARGLMSRLTTAADGGDAAAKQALAQLMAAQRGR